MDASTDEFRTLGPAADLPEQWVNPYYLADLKRRIAVARVGGQVYAFDDLHDSVSGPCPLSAGLLSGTTIMSQCDGTTFDLTTGTVVSGPGTEALVTHEVREQDGQLKVRL